jgi:hypothetical protein
LEAVLTLLDAANQPPPSKAPRYIIIAILAVAAIYLLTIFISHEILLRHEEQVVESFLNAVVSGDLQHAYQIWQPTESYSLKDFEDDWGPNGYYGPIKSYRVMSAFEPRRSSSDVAVRVLVSPYQSFPANDSPEQSKTKEVVIWVNRNTHSLSLGPPAM